MINWDCADRDLEFIRQLGVTLVYVWLPAEHHSVEDIRGLKGRLAQFGLSLHNVLSGRVAKNAAIHLNLPGRDAAVGEFISFLHVLEKAGIKNTTFTWEPDQVWSTADSQCRFSRARSVVSAELKDKAFTHGRLYTREELWDNFAYFMKAVIPEAEKTGVRLALHPNDPPVDFPIAGIPPLFRSAGDFRRAFALAESPALGMEFCCGCWLEGGAAFGGILENLAEFVDDGRVIIVHFRNITSPLPDFTETYLDNGYFDMYKIMKVLSDHGYDGTITLDHTPSMADGEHQYAPRAYATGYMRALAERAMA
jgi:mannonate dehydratase